jgi:hypothetical protein
MALETYRLSDEERAHLLAGLEELESCPSSNGLYGPTFVTIEHVILMLTTATNVEITYDGPGEDLCGNCAKPLDETAYSSYACSEPCEEAILERKHEAEEAGEEV